MKFNPFSILSMVLPLIGLCGLASAADAPGGVSLKTAWSASQAPLGLKTWSLSDLSRLKTSSSEHWRGVLISKFVDKALSELPLDQRAQVDLVIFKNAQGVQSIIPRSLITKYPLLLAYEKNHKSLADVEGPFAVVVPESTASRITSEGLPVTAYPLTGVIQVEFARYRAQFEGFFLKRRTDPAAIRGELKFVQNCISCHGAGRAPSITVLSSEGASRSLASTGHPAKVVGAPKLNSRDLRALVSYLDEYRAERPATHAQK